MRRLIIALLFVCIALAGKPPAAAEDRSITAGPQAFETLEALLRGELSSTAPRIPRPQAWTWLNQIRNHRAMKALMFSLPEDRRPSKVFYAASGGHLAPLVLCLAEPGSRPFLFVYGEVDPGVEGPIGELLRFLSRSGLVRDLEEGKALEGKPGTREWRFVMGTHPVTLRLLAAPPDRAKQAGPLAGLASMKGCELVITHDWSGDPIENLRIVLRLLLSAGEGPSPPPMLMMEDLEAHPYPVDMAFFDPVARTREPYGHRAPLTLPPGCPRDVELGTPLYGGGVILSFRDPWWKIRNGEALAGAIDFLLFNQFDEFRQNVLAGGDDPLLSPALLDWWTGFGTRSVGGGDLRTDPAIKARMVAAAADVLPLLPSHLQDRWACRMELYRSLLELEAGGMDVGALMPSARWTRRPSPGQFPTPEMDRLFREAAAHSGEYPEELARIRRRASDLLPSIRKAPYNQARHRCPAGLDDSAKGFAADWKAVYERCTQLLPRQ